MSAIRLNKGFEEASSRLRESPREGRRLALEVLGSALDADRWIGFAIIGSSFRAEARFLDAEAAFFLAACRRPRSPEAEAEVLGKLANVYRDQNHFELALRLLARKQELASDRLERAKATLESAVVRADPAYLGRDPRVSHHQAVLAREVFEAAGDSAYSEAAMGLELLCASEDEGVAAHELQDLLSSYRSRVRYPRGTLAAAQVDWLTGLVLKRLGKVEESRASLDHAAMGFESLGMPVFWAVVNLDLAALELTRGAYRRAAELCGLLFPVLTAYRQNSQAWAAMRALIEAAGQLALTHLHVANARRALLQAERLSRSDR